MLKILGKIDLSNTEKPAAKKLEFFKDSLDNFSKKMAAEINAEFGHFLQPDSRVDTESFDFPDKEVDARLVSVKEEAWASESGQDVATWRQKKEKHDSNISEMVVTAVLYKCLRSRFLVARSATYDDYENGFDSLVIDKKSGAVVCGFDEVVGVSGYSEKKDAKIIEKAKRGGAHVKYGATIRDGRLVRASLKNVPAFYLALSKSEIASLLENFSDSNITQPELLILDKFIISLEEQMANLEDKQVVQNYNLKNNLTKFKESLEVIKNIRNDLNKQYE